ncbi:MAG: glycosyltransferase [Isosphaeraceae bacterium]
MPICCSSAMVIFVRIERTVAGMGLAGRVSFLGARSDVPRLMLGAMDAFVFPSRYEGLGLVLIEAQAAGLPVVISDVIPQQAIVSPPGPKAIPVGSGAEMGGHDPGVPPTGGTDRP